MKKLTTTQKLIVVSTIVVAIAFLLGCGTNVNETAVIASDSLHTDTLLVDSVKVDTLK